MSSEKPERIRWAVEELSIQPKDKILEIGCGNGHAVALICQQLSAGVIVGMDRSPKAIRAAETNNRDCISAGKAQFLNITFAEMQSNERFDKIFAVNVNIFWTGSEREIALLHMLMHTNSRLYLFYEPPSSSQLEKIVESCKQHLNEANFEIVDVLRKRLTSNDGACIIAKQADI